MGAGRGSVRSLAAAVLGAVSSPRGAGAPHRPVPARSCRRLWCGRSTFAGGFFLSFFLSICWECCLLLFFLSPSLNPSDFGVLISGTERRRGGGPESDIYQSTILG